MNSFILVACFAAVAFAAPLEVAEPAPFQSSHVSDVDGSYTFTYASEDSSKTETRTPSGGVRGAFSYIDSEGVLQKVQYVADEGGFQAFGTNLPVGSTVPVKDTPEVLEATAQHFALKDQHLRKVALAEKLEAAYRAAHPELFQERTVFFAPQAPTQIRFVQAPVHQAPVFQTVEYVDEVPVAPEDDDEVKIARAQHLAIVEQLTNEHFAALAAAPKLEE